MSAYQIKLGQTYFAVQCTEVKSTGLVTIENNKTPHLWLISNLTDFDLIDSYTEAGVAHADLLSSYM